MTKVYFVRHAKPDFSTDDDAARSLTEEGVKDSKKVTRFLEDKNITKIFSSPYKRSIETIRDLEKRLDIEIDIIDDFRERKIDDIWIEDFNKLAKEQWLDFNYKLLNGESLKEVQDRNIKALMEIIGENPDENIVVGSHSTSLSTVINYFNKEFGYDEFERIKDYMPFIVCFTFDGVNIVSIEEFIL